MKAIILTEIGPPENLVLHEVPKPTITDTEVLIQVKAIGINPVDAFVRRTREAFNVVYQYTGLEKHIILGWDVAGVIVEAGSEVKEFKVGDEVFGNIKFIGQANGYAEYVAAPAAQLAIKPANISFEEAAGATMAALTAWVSIVQNGKIKPNDKIIIHAASGGVGHFAVQIAKHFGAYVIAVASSANKDFLLELGADEFIDYEKQQFESIVTDADIVHDAVWSEDTNHIERSLKALKKGGTLLSLVTYPDDTFKEKAKREKNVTVLRINVTPNDTHQADQKAIADLLASKKIKTHVSQTYAFKDMSKAHAAVETKSTVGKIVVIL